MSQRLGPRQRALFAVGGVVLVCLAIALALAGFSLSLVWPGLSWAVGGALALVVLFGAWRWLRAAITGTAAASRGQDGQRGTI